MMDFSSVLIIHFGLQLFCLSEAMINEASVDGDVGMIAVANVITNRSKSENWDYEYCDIVYDPSNDPEKPWACDFSYTCDEKDDIVREEDLDAYFRIIPIAAKVMSGEIGDITLGADHYVVCGVNRSWMKDMKFTVRIGNHCFYKEKVR